MRIRFGGTFFALVATSVLLAVSGSLLSGGDVPVQRYASAPVVVTGADWVTVSRSDNEKDVDLPGPRPLPPDIVDAIRRVAPHATVVPDFVDRVVIGSTAVVAHGWSSRVLGSLRLVDGTEPTRSDQIVADESFGWRPGQVVQTSGGPRTVAGTVALPGGAREPAIFVADRQGMRIAAVGVMADPVVADDLRTALPDVVVSTGDARGLAEFPDVAHARGELRTLAGSLIAVVLLVTLVVVGSINALAMSRRRKEISVLRAIGATPQQIQRHVITEMAVVGVVAGVAGLVPAVLAVFGFGGLLRSVGLLPTDFPLSLGFLAAFAAVVLTTLVAVVTGWIAVWRTMSTERPSRWGVIVGSVALVVGVAASALPLFTEGIVGVAVAGGGGLLLVTGVALLARLIVGGALRVVSRRLLGSAVPHRWLAGAGMPGQVTRLTASVAPMLLMVGLALAQVLVPASLAAAATRQADEGLKVGYVAMGSGVPVIRQPVVGVTTVLDGPETFSYVATGVRGPVSAVLDVGMRPGASWDPATPLAHDQVALGAMTAATLGASVGSRVELVLPDGVVVTPQVVGVYSRGLGLGDVLLDHSLLDSHRPVTDPVDFRLTSDAKDAVPAASLFTNGTEIVASTIPLIALFVYIAVSVINGLILSVRSRNRTFALLRKLGATHDQLARSLVIEGLVITAIAVVLGTAAALPPMVTVAYALTGTPWPAVPAWFYLGLVALVSALGMAVYSGRRFSVRPRTKAR